MRRVGEAGMELKAFRRRRVQEAMKDSNVQILIASLPQNIAYLTGGYVSVGQNVLCSSQAYVAYLLPEGKLSPKPMTSGS